MKCRTLFRRRFTVLFGVIFCLQNSLQTAYAQRSRDEFQKFSSVLYQYPFQFFYNGFKLGLDVNVNNRLVLQGYTQHIFTYYPRFYSLIGETNVLNVEFIPDKLSDSKLGIMLKSRIGKNSGLFFGNYAFTFAETGRGWESYATRLSIQLPESKFTNTYSYQKFGLGLGRHYTLFNRSVLDAQLGLGFYNYTGDQLKAYELPALFVQNADQAYVFASLGLGIGHSKPETPNSDAWDLKYGITIDFKAILKNSMELGLLTNNGPKSLWHFFAMYGSHEKGEQNITSARSFDNFAMGGQYRYYPYAGMRKEGVYFGGGLSTGYTKAVFRKFDNRGIARRIEQTYFPQHLIFSMGVTTFVANRFMMDIYASNTYTLAKGNTERIYPHPDEATGIHTVLGLKIGLVQMIKNEY